MALSSRCLKSVFSSWLWDQWEGNSGSHPHRLSFVGRRPEECLLGSSFCLEGLEEGIFNFHVYTDDLEGC